MARDTDNYIYKHSDRLGMEIAFSRDETHAYSSDGVMFTREEMDKIRSGHGDIVTLHQEKLFLKVFNGVVVDNNENRD